MDLSLRAPFARKSACAPLLVVDPGVKWLALERMVWVAGISRGPGDGFGDMEGDGDDGMEMSKLGCWSVGGLVPLGGG